jgi:hypothetical protein
MYSSFFFNILNIMSNPLIIGIIVGAVLLVGIVSLIVISQKQKKTAAAAEAAKKKPVDCVQSPWGKCDKPCGGGSQTRSITTQSAYGGKECGPASQPCNTQACVPVDCEMTNWGSCNADCGGGTQTRIVLKDPKYGGQPCGPTSQACNTQPCRGGTTRVQMCCPWEEADCPKAGAELTCDEFKACYKSKPGRCPCGGEAWFNKCGW